MSIDMVWLVFYKDFAADETGNYRGVSRVFKTREAALKFADDNNKLYIPDERGWKELEWYVRPYELKDE